MERFKYRAVNSEGRQVSGTISAANEVDLYNQLQTAGLELMRCAPIKQRGESGPGFFAPKISTRDLIQFFSSMEQLQGAGVPLLDSLSDIRDSTDNTRLRDVVTDVHRDVSDGSSISEAFEKHPSVFQTLHISLIAAGEKTGNLSVIFLQLVDYLTWYDDMQSKIKKATTYPKVVCVVVLGVVLIMMGVVVPQVVGFISSLGQELPIYTTALIATSDFVINPLFHIAGFGISGVFVVILVPFLLLYSVRFGCKVSGKFALQVDKMKLHLPVIGDLIRKITIARYAQTFGALYDSGIDVISSLKSARKTVDNLAMLEALEDVERQVKSGEPLSVAFNASGEFPSLVIRMLRIGEESGNLSKVLDQVSHFYSREVDEAIDALITAIEPTLTAVLGGVIMWVAVAVFGPIYGSFENMDF